jgi:AraC family transcriptional regulator
MASWDTDPALTAVRAGRPSVAVYPPGASWGPRTIDDFEFVWMLDGTAEYRGDFGVTTLRPGLLLLIRPGEPHWFRWDAHHPSRHGYLHFDVADNAWTRWPRSRAMTSDDPMSALCRYLLWLATDAAPAARHLTADVTTLVLRLFVTGPLPGTGSVALPRALELAVAEVRQRWRDDAMKPLRVAELANAAGMSASQLSRLFRRQFGCGPVTAFELVRLHRAAELLTRSELTVAATARACGFADAYHLSRRFRAAYGMPPRAYRQSEPADRPPSPVDGTRLAQLGYLLS